MNKKNVKYLTQMALLIAIIVLMAFTPLGYLRIGFVEITFIMIPVVIGAIVLGPAAGAILGGVFGITSFIQCFGMSAFGVMLLNASPVGAFVECVLTRVAAGWLAGLAYQLVQKWAAAHGERDEAMNRPQSEKEQQWLSILPYGAACFTGSIMNTILFVGMLGILFRNTMLGQAAGQGISLLQFLMSFVTVNSLVELAVCVVVGSAVAKAVHKITRSL